MVHIMMSWYTELMIIIVKVMNTIISLRSYQVSCMKLTRVLDTLSNSWAQQAGKVGVPDVWSNSFAPNGEPGSWSLLPSGSALSSLLLRSEGGGGPLQDIPTSLFRRLRLRIPAPQLRASQTQAS